MNIKDFMILNTETKCVRCKSLILRMIIVQSKAFKDGVPDLIRIAVDNDALATDFVFFRRGQLQDWEGDPVEKSMATLYGVGVGVTLEDVVRWKL